MYLMLGRVWAVFDVGARLCHICCWDAYVLCLMLGEYVIFLMLERVCIIYDVDRGLATNPSTNPSRYRSGNRELRFPDVCVVFDVGACM